MRDDAHEDCSEFARRTTRVTTMTTLHDGTYDAFIIWAEQHDDGVALECTITSGNCAATSSTS